VLGEPVTVPLVVAGVLMAVGIWLHLNERHESTTRTVTTGTPTESFRGRTAGRPHR
jgi:hypothetical protein